MKNDLSKVEKGDKIWTIQEGWTEVKKVDEDSDYIIKTNDESYTIDGKATIDDKYPSAFLECPFKDLPIEKDTLVYFREEENQSWKIGYYSHFRDGRHWCFERSRKSTETNKVVFWNIVTTENPLSC